jgi:hypothetical protein
MRDILRAERRENHPAGNSVAKGPETPHYKSSGHENLCNIPNRNFRYLANTIKEKPPSILAAKS